MSYVVVMGRRNGKKNTDYYYLMNDGERIKARKMKIHEFWRYLYCHEY